MARRLLLWLDSWLTWIALASDRVGAELRTLRLVLYESCCPKNQLTDREHADLEMSVLECQLSAYEVFRGPRLGQQPLELALLGALRLRAAALLGPAMLVKSLACQLSEAAVGVKGKSDHRLVKDDSYPWLLEKKKGE